MMHDHGPDASGHLPWPPPPSGAAPGEPVDLAAAYAMVDALLDGRATPEQRDQLQAWVIARTEVAELYARAVHLWCALPDLVRRPEHPVALLDPDPDEAVSDSMSETMILPALHEVDLAVSAGDSGEDDDIFHAAPTTFGTVRPARRFPAWLPGLAVAAAAAVVAIPTLWFIATPRAHTLAYHSVPAPEPAPVVEPLAKPIAGPTTAPVEVEQRSAVISAVAAARFRGDVQFVPGTVLRPGQDLDLTGGAVELTFDGGAVVLVSAPSRVRISHHDLLALEEGSLTAHVPPAAIGFRVNSAGLSVIDRGTDFGVRAGAADGKSEVTVFKGLVDALAGGAAKGTEDGSALRVSAGHAVAHQAGDLAVPHAIEFTPAGYLRDIAVVRVQLPVRNTGIGLPDGAKDPAWTVVAGPAGTPWTPTSAYAVPIDGTKFNPNTPSARWVSTAPKLAYLPMGNYTFRTTVDLTGFDPSTATVEAQFVADSHMFDVKVNGMSTLTWNPPVLGRTAASPPRVWHFPASLWKPGPNEVDVVVSNRPAKEKNVTYTALKWSWDATACPIVRR